MMSSFNTFCQKENRWKKGVQNRFFFFFTIITPFFIQIRINTCTFCYHSTRQYCDSESLLCQEYCVDFINEMKLWNWIHSRNSSIVEEYHWWNESISDTICWKQQLKKQKQCFEMSHYKQNVYISNIIDIDRSRS